MLIFLPCRAQRSEGNLDYEVARAISTTK